MQNEWSTVELNSKSYLKESTTPRSPNGFFYPANPAHYHYNAQGSANVPQQAPGGNGGYHGPVMYNYNHYGGNNGGGNYSSNNQAPHYAGMNGFNGNHSYVGQFHRPPGIGNIISHMDNLWDLLENILYV